MTIRHPQPEQTATLVPPHPLRNHVEAPAVAILLLALNGCASAKPSGVAVVLPPRPAATAVPVLAVGPRRPTETIVREASHEDPELAARNRGRLEVVVRSTDRPTQVLPGAQIRVGRWIPDTRSTDERGVAKFESLEVGEIELVVRRLGYATLRAVLTIKPGCRTDAAAYIATLAVDVDPPPARVIVTTCR